MFDIFNVLSSCSVTTLNERLALSCASSSLHDGSVIVEVGSAYGGSAHIITNSAPKCSLYCVDINDMLDDTFVDRSKFRFFKGNSASFACQHKGISIDMLFIDGDHSFTGVRSDFMSLAPMVREGGLVIFHDVIPLNFGVYIFVETLKRSGCFYEYEQIDSMCILKKSKKMPYCEASDFSKTVNILAHEFSINATSSKIVKSIENCPTLSDTINVMDCCAGFGNSCDNIYYIGRGGRGYLASKLIGVDFSKFLNSDQVSERRGRYVVFSTFFPEIFAYLTIKKCIAANRVFEFSESVLSYYIYEDIVNNNGRVFKKLIDNELENEIFSKSFLHAKAPVLHEMLKSNFLSFALNKIVTAQRIRQAQDGEIVWDA